MLEEEEEISENDDYFVDLQKVKGYVEFKHVHFGYNPEKIVINDFSTKVKPGQKIAIVGPTGAGKTTMVKLLMRFYDVNSGRILVDGHDIKNFKRKDLRSIFGMVLQDTWLYNGSIFENIRYGKLDATDSEIEKAACLAGVNEFIDKMEKGYDTEVGEKSVNLSTGQKQLISFARAIVSNPAILILDEATSSIDTETERLIQKSIENIISNRTSFVVAHRLSTIVSADKIVVMKKGKIVESGTHNELLSRGGYYYKLYLNQDLETKEKAV